jgi:hypothetical protein
MLEELLLLLFEELFYIASAAANAFLGLGNFEIRF